MSTLGANNLAKRYKGRDVVKDVSLAVESGEIVGLLGPNGAGKTTSFYMVVGLIGADHGSIMLDGEELTHLPMHLRARRGIGYLPQEASVFRKLSVAENILAILQTRKELAAFQQQQKLEEAEREAEQKRKAVEEAAVPIGHLAVNEARGLRAPRVGHAGAVLHRALAGVKHPSFSCHG